MLLYVIICSIIFCVCVYTFYVCKKYYFDLKEKQDNFEDIGNEDIDVDIKCVQKKDIPILQKSEINAISDCEESLCGIDSADIYMHIIKTDDENERFKIISEKIIEMTHRLEELKKCQATEKRFLTNLTINKLISVLIAHGLGHANPQKVRSRNSQTITKNIKDLEAEIKHLEAKMAEAKMAEALNIKALEAIALETKKPDFVNKE